MFTGIVQTTGTVHRMEKTNGDFRLRIAASAGFTSTVKAGDSVSVHGVCLSAAVVDPGAVTFDVSTETAARTVISSWTAGAKVNLETAMRAGDPIGGHLVSGHVDGVATVTGTAAAGRSMSVTLRASQSIARFIAAKGAVCVDGVSLTVNSVRDIAGGAGGCEFTVNLVPHTMGAAAVEYSPGARANVEVDMIARHLARLVECAP